MFKFGDKIKYKDGTTMFGTAVCTVMGKLPTDVYVASRMEKINMWVKFAGSDSCFAVHSDDFELAPTSLTVWIARLGNVAVTYYSEPKGINAQKVVLK